MKKPYYNGVNKDYEKLRQENKKLKEEYEKYKETTNEKLKDLELLISQNEKIRKENDELKKKLAKMNGGNNANQSITSKSIDKLKIDLYNKEATISLISKQKDFLISIITRITNLNLKNKISKDIILSHLDEKNIDKEKDKEKLTNDIIHTIQEGKKNIANTNQKSITNLSKNNFSFEILSKKNSKLIGSKNNKGNSSFMNGGGNEKNNYKKEAELIRKLDEMLVIIKKKKDLLKSKKSNLSFRIGTIKEGK
jgi:hypothetical protein